MSISSSYASVNPTLESEFKMVVSKLIVHLTSFYFGFCFSLLLDSLCCCFLDYGVVSVHHVGILCENLERSLDFYQNILGM